MKRVVAELSDSEALDFFRDKKPHETIRDYLLRIKDIDAPKRKVGRPRRIPSSLDILGVPGAIRTTTGSVAREALKDKYGEGWKPKKPKKEGE